MASNDEMGSFQLSLLDPAGMAFTPLLYRHREETFPDRTVQLRHGSYLRRFARDISLDLSTIVDGISGRTLHGLMSEFGFTGCIVVQDGAIKLEEYRHGNTPASRNDVQSVTKSFISTVLAIAHHEKKLSIEDTVARHVEELRDTAWADIPLIALISMSSGVVEQSDEARPADIPNPMYATELYPRTDAAAVLDWLKTFRKVAEPWEEFHYYNPNYYVLSTAIVRAVGEPLEDYMSSRIWEPAGMQYDGYIRTTAAGHVDGHGGLSITLTDMTRFGCFVLDGLTGGKGPAVSPQWFQDISEAKNTSGPRAAGAQDFVPGFGYEAGWWTPGPGATGYHLADEKAFAAIGITIRLDPPSLDNSTRYVAQQLADFLPIKPQLYYIPTHPSFAMAPPTPFAIDIPWSSSTVSVSIIDTSVMMGGFPTPLMFGPTIPGLEHLDVGSWSFLIEHPDGRLVFDLGLPSQWQTDLPPAMSDAIRFTFSEVDWVAPQYVSDILEGGGISLDTIDAVIWSHTHMDHIGRPSLFPSSTDLIVGEGTLETFGLGYPDSPNSPYLARELHNRTVTEIPFPTNATRIGGLAAFDYFGDGSFYLLQAPGHETGHINALARVTKEPPSFIYMGGDSYHHGSQLRPNRYIPLPEKIYLEHPQHSVPELIPGKLLAKLHPSQRFETLPSYAVNLTSPDNTPFAVASLDANGTTAATQFPDIARDVISKLQLFDADDRVFIVGAHDETVRGIVDLFPKKANRRLSKPRRQFGLDKSSSAWSEQELARFDLQELDILSKKWKQQEQDEQNAEVAFYDCLMTV
ncbi:Cytochrome P450 monooxygenase mpaDE [Paramyrothecium foliicola]|nr:Cytochrome P450 monooxygenase mpaDE [Paramyrothecium foliicola]